MKEFTGHFGNSFRNGLFRGAYCRSGAVVSQLRFFMQTCEKRTQKPSTGIIVRLGCNYWDEPRLARSFLFRK